MKVAAKYEDIYPPTQDDFIYICDKAYTGEQILECEAKLIEALDFSMSP